MGLCADYTLVASPSPIGLGNHTEIISAFSSLVKKGDV
jgi:hypothetical protein